MSTLLATTETVVQPCCYVSTPEHIRTVIGRFVYIYTGKAELELDQNEVRLTRDDGFGLRIPLDDITGLDTGRYSLWAKPFGLDYIAVSYVARDRQRCVLLTPTRSWRTPTWTTNEIVADWLELLRQRIDERRSLPGDY